MAQDIRNFLLAELEAQCRSLGVEPYRARQVFEWLYRRDAEDFSSMTNLPARVRDKLADFFVIEKIVLEKIETSRDLTQKFLVRLKDDSLIESVSIPVKSRLTACLSTQVGCKFSCVFCASGDYGFKRNLFAAEILAQFLLIRRHVPEQKISHVVFMGIREPLDNYDHLLKAVRILNAKLGINLGIRKMTISTCGLAPAIERLAQEGLEIELSVSLHAATDSKREALLPINRKYPINVLLEAVRRYMAFTKRKVTLEYLLLGGYNTAVEDAQALVKLLRGLDVRVNLIPYNSVISKPGFSAPSKLEVLFFKSYLAKKGVDVTLRLSRGADITAACGQLRAGQAKERASHES